MAKSGKTTKTSKQGNQNDDAGKLLPLDIGNTSQIHNNQEDDAILFSLDINKGSKIAAPKIKHSTNTATSTPKTPVRNTVYQTPAPVYTPPVIQNPAPAQVPVTKQKKGCGCKTILIAWFWIGIISAIFNSEYFKKFQTKADEMLAKLEIAFQNPEDAFSELKNNNPLLSIYHENIDLQIVDGDTTISLAELNPAIYSLIIIDSTILSRHRYYIPSGTLKYNLSKKKKNKRAAQDTYVYLKDKLFYVSTDIEPEAKVVFMEKPGERGFKLKLKDLRYYKEIGLVVMYNDFDYFMEKKYDTLYVPEALYMSIKNGISYDTLSMRGCGMHAYYK